MFKFLDKGKRMARDEEFKPLDIQATIPFKAQQAENERQLVQNKYDAMQLAIDSATPLDAIKTAMPK